VWTAASAGAEIPSAKIPAPSAPISFLLNIMVPLSWARGMLLSER
jgi:hypothetical protein